MSDWIIRVSDAEYRARSVDQLREWRRQGRIPDGSYVYHPVLERWLYAREVEELRNIPVNVSNAVHSTGGGLDTDISGAKGCLIVIAVIALIWGATSAVQSCNNARDRAREAREAEQRAELARQESVRQRTEVLAALSAPTDAAVTANLCDQLGSLDGVSSDILRKCAEAHIAQGFAATQAGDFSRAAKLADIAESEGAKSHELLSIRKAVEKHETNERAWVAAERRREEARLKAAVSRMTTRHDKLEGVKWYRDRTSPDYNNRNAFFLYFGEKSSSVWLRWRVQYFAEDWLFIQQFTVYADGVPYEYSGVDFERDHASGDIWEWYDASPTTRDLEMIRAVIASKEATVRFEGRQYRNDRTISAEQKRALQRVLDAFAAKGGSV
jgi:hypothetical protein